MVYVSSTSNINEKLVTKKFFFFFYQKKMHIDEEKRKIFNLAQLKIENLRQELKLISEKKQKLILIKEKLIKFKNEHLNKIKTETPIKILIKDNLIEIKNIINIEDELIEIKDVIKIKYKLLEKKIIKIIKLKSYLINYNFIEIKDSLEIEYELDELIQLIHLTRLRYKLINYKLMEIKYLNNIEYKQEYIRDWYLSYTNNIIIKLEDKKSQIENLIKIKIEESNKIKSEWIKINMYTNSYEYWKHKRKIFPILTEKFTNSKKLIKRYINFKNPSFLNIAPLTIFDNIIFIISRYYTS